MLLWLQKHKYAWTLCSGCHSMPSHGRRSFTHDECRNSQLQAASKPSEHKACWSDSFRSCKMHLQDQAVQAMGRRCKQQQPDLLAHV